MTEHDWLSCTDPAPMLEFLRGKASDRKLRLFAVACCRRLRHLLVDERSRNAVTVAERFADDAATEHELEAARQDAWEFTLHIVHEDEVFFDLGADALNAADAPAWAAEWSVEPARVVIAAQRALGAAEGRAQSDLLRCIVGNPFHPVAVEAVEAGWLSWNGGTVRRIAEGIYDERFVRGMAELADVLKAAGCTNQDILRHCHETGGHVRGCWVVDLILGKS